MALASRTVNPLHFDDLEPKRFEDLVRQLAYDFRTWRKLEATGRSGSDDGFDARGLEIVGEPSEPVDEDPSASEEVTNAVPDRIWLIQCKREKTIGPTKLVGYLDGIAPTERAGLHGIVFVAPCEFSKKARDAFYAKSREFGITESHIWGRGELEDQLFLPKNDHLLFAYFGISLTIRRRSLRTEVRARLAMKRKAYRVLEPKLGQEVLLRDPSATQYPYSGEVTDFKKRPPWKVYELDALIHSGLKFRIRRSFAYIADDGKEWDVALKHNDTHIFAHQDPWAEPEEEKHAIRAAVTEVWEKLPDKNKAWLESYAIVPYEAILDIDERGDDVAEMPHVYVPFEHDGRPFKYFLTSIENISRPERVEIYPGGDEEGRLSFFPEKFRTR